MMVSMIIFYSTGIVSLLSRVYLDITNPYLGILCRKTLCIECIAPFSSDFELGVGWRKK